LAYKNKQLTQQEKRKLIADKLLCCCLRSFADIFIPPKSWNL